MNDFTASNGITVGPGRHMPHAVRNVGLTPSEFSALREFFQAEADERLGRWRWPENPEWVLYPDEDGDVVALDESNGQSTSSLSRLTVSKYPTALGCAAARAYFDAHPEPKPWHDAKPGEVWVLKLSEAGGGSELPWTVANDSYFTNPAYVDIRTSDTTITSGRRIWPEVSS